MRWRPAVQGGESGSGLTPWWNLIAYENMKFSMFLGVFLVLAMAATGCVKKVSGGATAGMPFVRDSVQGQYQRPVETVFTAAREVLRENGSLSSESIQHGDTNQVKTLVGKVDQRTVYVRVAPVDASITSVRVQARTSGGGADLYLAHELEKQIALKLVR